ncbi:TRAP transporter substrate-binding protein [Ammoniphilus sp. YIM 78166]|uniref:TRAP transporter substrate-binding protein n=1 Tax=Ammoniphilus sp. YIM 78166 TaxID=1644106 RepID=UPI0010705477|nr:TRAP transporter substrate-binding protein [Ammoniphilus sp. YIM 78166]
MKKWAKNLTISLVIPSLLLLGGCGAGNNAGNASEAGASQEAANSIQKRTVKAGIVLQQDHSTGKGLKKFAELVEQKSGGLMKVQPFYSGQLGDEKKMIEAAQAGMQEVAITTTPPLRANIKEFGIFDLPFVFSNVDEGAAVLDGPVGQKLIDKLPDQNLVGLAYWENGMRSLTNSKHPVASVKDFQGLKIRTQQNEIHLGAFKALGSNPIPMPYTEVFTAMESKTIDGAENALPVFESDKYNEVQEYLSLTEHLYSSFIVLVSKKFWDQLSPEEQKIMEEAAAEARDFQRETNRADVNQSLDNLKAAGMKVNEISPEEKKNMQEAVQPVVDKFAKDLGEELVREMYDEVEKVRK